MQIEYLGKSERLNHGEHAEHGAEQESEPGKANLESPPRRWKSTPISRTVISEAGVTRVRE